jgi:hypothetical protein
MEPESKIDEPVQVPATSRGRWRRVALRTVRYSFLTLFALLIVLAAASWNRSYKTADRIVGVLRKESPYGVLWDRSYLVGSNRGEIVVGTFIFPNVRLHYASAETIRPWRVIETGSVKKNIDLHGIKIFNTRLGGFVLQSDGEFKSDDPEFGLWGNSVCIDFDGVIVPHWAAVLISGSLFTIFLLGYRFSLRAFLIWVTFICVILGIAMRSSSDSASPKQESGQHGA